LYDNALFSTHPKRYDDEIEEFENESKRNLAALELLLMKTRASIKIIEGNHDVRPHDRLMEVVPRNLLRFVTFNSPIDLLVQSLGSDRVERVNLEVAGQRPGQPEPKVIGHTRHMCVVGDALLSHANFSGSKPGDAAYKCYLWANEWRRFLGWPDFGAVIQFHTHQWSHVIAQGGFLALVEPGMMGEASVEQYKIGYNAKWKPGMLGAVSFEQSNVSGVWKTDLNSIRPIR
jgi:hypothetical protein